MDWYIYILYVQCTCRRPRDHQQAMYRALIIMRTLCLYIQIGCIISVVSPSHSLVIDISVGSLFKTRINLAKYPILFICVLWIEHIVQQVTATWRAANWGLDWKWRCCTRLYVNVSSDIEYRQCGWFNNLHNAAYLRARCLITISSLNRHGFVYFRLLCELWGKWATKMLNGETRTKYIGKREYFALMPWRKLRVPESGIRQSKFTHHDKCVDASGNGQMCHQI